MSSRRPVRQILVAVLLGVLVGGGLMAVTPAGAEVSQAAATSWKKIWKKELKPLAAKSFYTKSKASSTFATKAESSAGDAAASAAASAAANAATDAKLGGYYKKAESDAKYAGAGSGYTKAESDARYAPAQPLYRGTYMLFGNNPAAGYADAHGISFGATFAAAPTSHYIKVGDPIPVGCSGTSAAPNAAAGHLCVFESYAGNIGSRGLCRGGDPATCPGADPFGAAIYAYSAAAGTFELYGTWAARPSGAVVNPSFAPAGKGAVNDATSSGQQPMR